MYSGSRQSMPGSRVGVFQVLIRLVFIVFFIATHYDSNKAELIDDCFELNTSQDQYIIDKDNYILKRNNPFIIMSIVLNIYPPIIQTKHYSNTTLKATNKP